MKKNFLYVLVVLLFGALVFPACSKSSSGGAGGAGSGGKGGKKNVEFPVEVAKIELRPVEYEVKAPGTIEAFERVQVTARVSGAVDKISFSEGSEVTAGQVLVTIERDRYALAVDQANVALGRAKATLADVEGALERREDADAKKPGIVPAEELATYRTKVALAKSDVDQALATLRQASLNLRDSYVKAPIAGVMQSRSVETGQWVQPGMILGTLLRRDPLLLRFQVTTQEAPRIKPGMIAKFGLRESKRDYEAKVTLVSGAADAKTHLVGITAEIDDKDHAYWLRPGAFCDVSVAIGNARLSPVIPQTAFRASERGFLAYVVENGLAHEKVLKLGMHTADGLVEVTDGLKPGDMLVIHGVEPLADKTPVKIVGTGTIAGSASAKPSGASNDPPAPSGSKSPGPPGAPSASGKPKKPGAGGAP